MNRNIFARPSYVNVNAAATTPASGTTRSKRTLTSASLSTPMRMAFLTAILIMNAILLYMWIASALPSRVLWYAFAASMGILAGIVLFFGGGIQGKGTQLTTALIFVAPFINVILFETYVANAQTDRGTAFHKRKASRVAGISVVSLSLVAALVILTSTRTPSSLRTVFITDAVQEIGLGILV